MWSWWVTYACNHLTFMMLYGIHFLVFILKLNILSWMSTGRLGDWVQYTLSQIDQFNHPRDMIHFKAIINRGHNHLESNNMELKYEINSISTCLYLNYKEYGNFKWSLCSHIMKYKQGKVKKCMWILLYQRMVVFHEGPKLGVQIAACNRVIHKVLQRGNKQWVWSFYENTF